MTKLYISLVFTAVASLLVTHWLIDHFFAGYGAQPYTEEHQLALKMLDHLATQATQIPAEELPAFIARQREFWQQPLTLESHNDLVLPTELLQQMASEGHVQLASEEDLYILKTIPGQGDWFLRLDVPAARSYSTDLMLTLLLYLGIIGLMMVWLLPLTRRLSLLSQAADKVGKGQLTIRIPKASWSYTPGIEASFNRMAAQIEQLLADNQLLVNSLSHDLRTPIACFRFGLDAAHEETDPEQRGRYLERMEKDVERMEGLVNASLEYAGLSRLATQLEFAREDLADSVRQAMAGCQALAEARHLKLHYSGPNHYTHPRINDNWLQRALVNLISNACRYARSEVWVHLNQTPTGTKISIADDGPGIDPDQAEQVFLPFVRIQSDTERLTPTEQQFGLGLAIAKQVTQWHNGQLVLTRHPSLGGAEFTLNLP